MITNKDIRFMDVAYRHAASTERAFGYRFGVLIVIKNRIIAFGTSKEKTHPFQMLHGKNEEAIYLHAEIDAVRNALRFVDENALRKATMYIARAKNEHPVGPVIPGKAKPCKGCMGLLSAWEFRKIVYTTGEDNPYEVLERT